MSKPVTLADLTNALKPIIETMARLREEHMANKSQISEIHGMTTNISVKIDTLEQTTGATLSEVSKPVVKKTIGRKPVAGRKPATSKKPVIRRGAKTTPQKDVEVPDDSITDGDTLEGNDQKTDLEDAAEVDDQKTELDDAVAVDADDGDIQDNTQEEIKLPVKKAEIKLPIKKAETKLPVKKSVTKKPAAKKPVTAPRPNKMTIFRDVYKSNPEKFDEYLTAKVKNNINVENNKKWKDLQPEPLATAQRTAYYHYMKDNYNDVLEQLKVLNLEQ